MIVKTICRFSAIPKAVQITERRFLSHSIQFSSTTSRIIHGHNKILQTGTTNPISSAVLVLSIRSVGSTSESVQKTAPKSFTAASFALPKNPEPSIQTNIQPGVPQEDIDDFNATKLVHGKTDMQIAITKIASEKLNKIAVDDNNINTALKIGVESGGCHGFQYNLDLTDLEKELAQDEDDELLVFKRIDESGNIAQIILDESSLEILQDSKLDYTKELIGSSFKIVDSPYTSTSCGCGASFDFDFEKLQKTKRERAASK
ncbi:hypothetical protein G9P44_000415 [Scheffersomyces stipitis]|nr:hypothetical protein G9P44_000415 [Scheffersomyces stipitis]